MNILYAHIGMNSVQIAALTGFSSSGVRYLINRLFDRCQQSFLFNSSYKTILKRLKSELLPMPEEATMQ